MRAQARRKSQRDLLATTLISILAPQPRGRLAASQFQTTEVQPEFQPSLVAGRGGCRGPKRCQSREIKGGHLSGGPLGFSDETAAGLLPLEPALGVHV